MPKVMEAPTLYDTMARQARRFEPVDPERVVVYVCGPTVYDEPHLGHARAAVVFDVLVRLLRAVYGDGHVTYIRNYTDVDDKIIARANEAGIPIDELTVRYTDAYVAAVRALGCADPDITPKVTEVMDEIVAFVADLEAKGAAYAADGGVYFDVRAFDGYGKLSHRDVDELQTVHRVEVDPRKRNPLDFALWKEAKEGEPSWDSPWGPGRPGWHIECSVMATRFGRETLDIHGGGQDLIFPHHENEIAQCEARTGQQFARYWLHNGFVQINAEKMSKSLHNFKTVGEIIERWPAEAVRYFLLSAHYRTPLDFTLEGLAEAVKALMRIYDALAVVEAGVDAAQPEPGGKQAHALAAATERLEAAVPAMEAALLDDLNTPLALGRVFEALRELNGVVRRFPQGLPAAAEPLLNAAAALRTRMRTLLGLPAADGASFRAAWNECALGAIGLDGAEVERQIAARVQARADRDFGRADDLRDALEANGVALSDGAGGTQWWIEPDAVAASLGEGA